MIENSNIENWEERTLLQVGEAGLKRLHNAKVAIIGLGGVGAFAAEMMCRAGIRSFVIADADTYNETNKNRQLGALNSTIGRKKTEIISLRMKDINPKIDITIIEEYITQDNIDALLSNKPIDFLVDAIDTLSPKISLIKYCILKKIPVVSSMGAGAKYDATKVRISDIEKSYNCPLAYMLRKRLRKEGIHSGFKVVFSEELPDKKAIIPFQERNKKSRTGTLSYLPAVFGCICAQATICKILGID